VSLLALVVLRRVLGLGHFDGISWVRRRGKSRYPCLTK
jgi:hypothetical protein